MLNMRLGVFISKIYFTFPHNTAKIGLRALSFKVPLKNYPSSVFISSRNLSLHDSLLKNDEQFFNEKKEETKKKSNKEKPKKVHVIRPDGGSSYMFLKELEKYAERNKLKIHKEEDLYKLEKLADLTSFNLDSKSTVKKKSIKKVTMSSDICDHDFKVKMNQALKLLEKGSQVNIIVDFSSSQSNPDHVLAKLNESALNEFKITTSRSSRQICLVYIKKKTKESDENEVKEEVKEVT